MLVPCAARALKHCPALESKIAKSRAPILILCDGFSTVEITNVTSSMGYSLVCFKHARQFNQAQSRREVRGLETGK
jgi:hypothetical protein